MIKRILALGLAALLTFSLVGCGGSGDDASKEVTLKWVISQAEQKDSTVVEEEINNLLSELLPNTKLEIIHSPKMSEKWSMWMAAKQSYDIATFTLSNDLISYVYADSFMELDEFVEEYAPNIKQEMEDFPVEYESGITEDALYAIPNVQSIVHQVNFLTVDAEHWQYFPVDEFLAEAHANAKTTEKMYQLCEQFLDKLDAIGTFDNGSYSVDVANFINAVVTRGYDWVGSKRGGAWLCYDALDPDALITSFVNTDAYKLWLKYAARWYEKGYISEDYIVSGSAGSMVLAGNITETWVNLDEERGVKYNKDDAGNIAEYKLLVDSEKNLYQGTSIFGSALTYKVIPYTAENPERAMKLIDLLHSDEGEELLNLMVYGFEKNSEYASEHGVWHYELKDDVAYGNGYTIQPDSTNDYGIAHWRIGNLFHAYRTPNILDGQEEWAMNYLSVERQKLYKTKYYNFKGNLRDLSYKIAQINSAMSEYSDALVSGTLKNKYEATYNEMINKMNAAGLEDVIKEVQAQADEFIK